MLLANIGRGVWIIPLISSRETKEGCNRTLAWIKSNFESSTTTLAENKNKIYVWKISQTKDNKKWIHWFGCLSKANLKQMNYSPPQQKPAAPIADMPLLFKASITAFASSNPLSCQSWNTKSFQRIIFNSNIL